MKLSPFFPSASFSPHVYAEEGLWKNIYSSLKTFLRLRDCLHLAWYIFMEIW